MANAEQRYYCPNYPLETFPPISDGVFFTGREKVSKQPLENHRSEAYSPAPIPT